MCSFVCLVAHRCVGEWRPDVKAGYQPQVSTSGTAHPLLLRQDLSLAGSRPCRLGWLASKRQASTRLHFLNTKIVVCALIHNFI